MFNDLSGIECFVKDTAGRRLRVSDGIWKRLGFGSEREMVGKKDHDLFPASIADQYQRSDQRVISSGLPLVDELEVWITEQGVLDWFLVCKYPVFGPGGEVIGVMGTIRLAHLQRGTFASLSSLGAVMDHVREHFGRSLSLRELAGVAGLSERQLRRRFTQELGVGVAAFVVKTRIQVAASRLLKSRDSVSKIAAEVGFCDQSAFTKAFRSALGFTPREYRRLYAGTS